MRRVSRVASRLSGTSSGPSAQNRLETTDGETVRVNSLIGYVQHHQRRQQENGEDDRSHTLDPDCHLMGV